MLGSINIINGINTDIGKTFVTCKIIIENILKSKKINALKPIISGFNFEEKEVSDAGKILHSMGLEVTKENLNNITRYFLKNPFSPNIAAEIEKIDVSYSEILKFCIEKTEISISKKQPIIIEMSGGICSPITNEKTMLDLTTDINLYFKGLCKNFLITSNYLGAISHTISACKLFKFDEIIFNPFPKTEQDSMIKKTLETFLKEEVKWCPWADLNRHERELHGF